MWYTNTAKQSFTELEYVLKHGSEERTRQGKAMQPVKSCHLPATMGSCVKRGTGVAAGSCHVYFLDSATHFREFERENHFSEWNERENSFQWLELVSEAIFPPN